MKAAVALLFLAIVFAWPAFGQTERIVERGDNTSARKSVKGFGAHLFLVEKPKEFLDLWEKSWTPHIDTISDVKARQQFGAFILFTGCRPDSSGRCDCEVDFDVYKPDGKLFVERKGQELWKQPVPSSREMQLGVASLFLRMGTHDIAGQYMVKATVRDKNANVDFEVETSFRLAPNKG
jgi:hypothetical protein